MTSYFVIRLSGGYILQIDTLDVVSFAIFWTMIGPRPELDKKAPKPFMMWKDNSEFLFILSSIATSTLL